MSRDYSSQAVRDLVWALETPSMVEHPLAITGAEGADDLAHYPGVLGRFDHTGSELHEAVSRRSSSRLGEYFEILVTTWLDALPPVSLIAANEQVKGGGGTVGEFDLVFARDDDFHHWELAIKFYLGHPGPPFHATGGERDGDREMREPLWYGPNPVDRFDKKWGKMKEKQLMLGRTRDGRLHLERMGVPDEAPVYPAAFLKGYLFEPLDEQFAVDLMPETNPEVPMGWWVHRSAFKGYRDRLEAGRKVRWLKLPRLQWMSPARESPQNRSRSFGPFEHDLRSTKPALVAALVDGEEVTRGFVVPDRWPSR
jgi:hypothetical protein